MGFMKKSYMAGDCGLFAVGVSVQFSKIIFSFENE